MQILDAAIECIAANGFHATTMDDIVAASGLSKGSLYWHFDGKLDVLMGVFDTIVARLFEDFERIEHESGSVPDALAAQIARFVEILGAEPRLLAAWAELLHHRELRDRMAEMYRESRSRTAALVRKGVREGSLRRQSAPGVAVALTALIEGLLLQALMDPTFDVQAHAEISWKVVAQGIER